jgi:SNF2 family DNA or RNA helicase
MAWKSKKTLRPYQIEDVADLVTGKRVILASDTGCGKTLCYIRTSEQLFEENKVTKMFVFCPASTRLQVRDSINAETSSRALVIHGTPAQREKQLRKARKANVRYIIFGMSQMLTNDFTKIISLLEDCKAKGRLGIIVDEAYYLKDGLEIDAWGKRVASLRTQALFSIRKYFEYRYLVTGTPVQNSPADAFWLIYYMYGSKILGNKDEFDSRYVLKNQWGVPMGAKRLKEFNERISPYMIRRSADDPDVARFMPKIVTENIVVTLDTVNFKRCYRLLRAATLRSLDALASYPQGPDADAESIRMRERCLRAAQTRYAYLKMLCVGGTAILLKRQRALEKAGKPSFLHKFVEHHPDLFDKPNWGPKIDSLAEFIRGTLREKPENKFVVFCYFRDALDHVGQVLTKELSCKVVVCKGGDNDQNKKHAFNHDPATRVFVTSDANREGVDLPGGSHLIQLDMPHNFAVYWQRVTRIRRTGSKHKTVYGFNAILSGTIEERQLEHIERTRALSKAIVDGKPYKKDMVGMRKAGLLLNGSTLSKFLKGDTFGNDVR